MDTLFFWTSTVTAAASFLSGLLALFFRSEKSLKAAGYLLGVSFLLLTAHGIVRWIESGHPPFVTRFESMTLAVWFSLLVFFLLKRTIRRIDIVLVPVSLLSFLLMGWSATLPREMSPLSAALDNVWLFIHASFATVGAATFVIAVSFSAVYLLGKNWLERHTKTEAMMPDYDTLPGSTLNLVVLGLILWGVMIVSGSIWAHKAWGRYWAWDPIELWSLISWLLYGLVVHARIGFKISNRLLSWMVIIAALTVVFALWGVNYVYQTIHTYG